VIAHTRFATSSINKVSELHPHEWSPFKEEVFWRFNPIIGKYERSSAVMGVHITHNGDFDELEAYQQVGACCPIEHLLCLCVTWTVSYL
jgi:hypothetical protein